MWLHEGARPATSVAGLLRALVERVRRSSRKVEREKRVLASLPGLSLQIVAFAREHGCITMGDATQLIGASRNTLKQRFRVLVEGGDSKQHGGGRKSGTR